jgi:beta-glucosidase
MYFKGTPLYPFGYGLSYTAFRYSTLRCSATSLDQSNTITASVDVSNTGTRDGDEVVQLYVGYPASTTFVRPTKRLIGFKRITVRAGQQQTVSFTIGASSLATWDDSTKSYRTPAGTVRLMVGGSSSDTGGDLDITVL